MEITVYASDVRNFDEEVDKHFDVKDWHGSDLFDKDDRLSLDSYKYHLEPYTYVSIMADMQEQINELRALIPVMTHQHEQLNELRLQIKQLKEDE